MNRRLASLLAVACAAARCPPPPRAAPKPKPAPQPRAAPDATVKIKVGHLKDGRAEIYADGPGLRHAHALRRRPAGRGHLLPRRQGAGQPQAAGRQGRAATAASAPASIVREDGKYAVSAKHEATAGARRRQHRPQELEGQLPVPAPGPVRRRRRRLQEGDAEDGLHRQQRQLLRRQDRARRPRLPQSQRHEPQHARRRRPGQEASSPARAATRCATRTPASTSRRRSPSRSWSSPRATSRSRSTRSPPASPRPRRSPATSSSSARTGLQLARDVLLVLLLRRLRGPRLRIGAGLPRQPRLPAHLHRRPAARSTNRIYFGEDIFIW